MKTTMSQGEKWTFDGQSVLDSKGLNACTKTNGPLIAAAPDLLEACKVALSRLHHYTYGMESCDMPVKDERAIAALKSAIERATAQKEGAK